MCSQLGLYFCSFYFFHHCFICRRSDSILLKFAGIEPRNRIHERTISWRFLGIILRVLRLVVPYTMLTLQTSFKSRCSRGRRSKIRSRGDCEQQGGKLYRLFPQLSPRIRLQDCSDVRIDTQSCQLIIGHISHTFQCVAAFYMSLTDCHVLYSEEV